jgi:hypothetical protein
MEEWLTYRNGKDGPVVSIASLDHGVGGLEELHNHANDGNWKHRRLQHERRCIFAASPRSQHQKVKQHNHQRQDLNPQHDDDDIDDDELESLGQVLVLVIIAYYDGVGFVGLFIC